MTNAEKLTLKKHACHIRMGVIEGTHSAGCGHPGGSLSIADVLSYLYFKELNVDPAQPKMANRDRLVLSKGHAAPALYAALAERGFFPVEELKTLRKIGSRLQGHPNMNSVPSVDMSTGSLGQGISAACGMALGAKHAGSAVNVYAILGDGEVEEGECWEAFMFAAHYGLSNLCVMLDRNHLQIDGTTETVMNSAPLEDKLRAFNFNVVTINGHDFDQIESAVQAFHAETEKPTCIISVLLLFQRGIGGVQLVHGHLILFIVGALAVPCNGIGHIGNAGALDGIQNDAGGLFVLSVESGDGALNGIKIATRDSYGTP